MAVGTPGPRQRRPSDPQSPQPAGLDDSAIYANWRARLIGGNMGLPAALVSYNQQLPAIKAEIATYLLPDAAL